MASTTPGFWVGVQGSTTPSFMVSSANTNGFVGIGSSSPSYGLSFNLATGTAATSTASWGSSTNPSCHQLFSPNGTAYRVYVSNAGTLTTAAGSCN